MASEGAARGRRPALRWWAAGFGLLVLLAAGGFGLGSWEWQRPGPSARPTTVIVPHGDGLRVQHALATAGVLREGAWAQSVFRAGVWLTWRDGALHAAELAFPGRVSMRDAAFILRHASPVQHHLTIPEGWTARQIAALLARTDTLKGPVPEIPEGSVLPETVAFVRGTPRATIVLRLREMMQETLMRAWAGRDPGIVLADPRALLVLASLVERETGVPAERGQIARVFLNRLARGMRLQSDPTVIYDLSEGAGWLDHPLTHDELAEAGAENTYRIPGLPPAPICSPGRGAIEAVAHPPPGNAVYFVATGTGGHRFAATLDEHNRNIDLYRQHVRGAPGVPGP